MRTLPLLLLLALLPIAGRAQDNYEIQVYGSDLVAPGNTMFEFHTNFTAQGSKTVVDGVEPTNHAMHETLEITHGFTDWFETGFYVFSSIQPNGGWQWVGDHIRPRLAIPVKWHWPVGLSISQEIGYTQAHFTGDTWTYELRPIIDRTQGPWYFGFNPTFERSLHVPSVSKGWEFLQHVKISYDVTPQPHAGVEYYGALGPATEFAPRNEQDNPI